MSEIIKNCYVPRGDRCNVAFEIRCALDTSESSIIAPLKGIIEALAVAEYGVLRL